MDPLFKLWLLWMPFAFGFLMLSEQDKYNPHNERYRWELMIFCAIIWPLYYVFALFHKRRG